MDTEQTPHQQGLISAGAAAAASNTHTHRGGEGQNTNVQPATASEVPTCT